MTQLTIDRAARAKIISKAGNIEAAIQNGALKNLKNLSTSEAIILGLLRQDVKRFFTILGHGSTELGEVLRIYEEAGVLRSFGLHHETEAAHAASALRWITNEKAAVVTSIGPGALQAFAGSLLAASDGLGVWFLFGDETSEDEGPNMQQVPNYRQHNFLKMFEAMGDAYCLHTPGSLQTALRRGMNTVDHPHRGAPFFLLMPMNVQPQLIENFNLRSLPSGAPAKLGAAEGATHYQNAADAIFNAKRVVVKCGGGSRHAGEEISELLDLADGVAVTSPLVSGVIPHSHKRNMTVGGSKGSISGNYAMENADLLIAIGTRAVCQSDCSRTGYPHVKKVININTDLNALMHYEDTVALLGDAKETLKALNSALKKNSQRKSPNSAWLIDCQKKREEWNNFRQKRYENPLLYDEAWKREVLTQPAVIKTAIDWSHKNNAVNIFDAGDVQANGFQIVEDDRIGRTFTDTGSSYMGFAVSALMASVATEKPFYGLAFTGDGSFFMNPQILVDGVAHGVKGCILLLDNRRMGAISSLQTAQYEKDYATWDHVPVDFVQLASSVRGVNALFGGYSLEALAAVLDQAKKYDGLSLIHVPVYYGEHELGGLGAFGRWNVGNWVTDTQKMRHEIGI